MRAFGVEQYKGPLTEMDAREPTMGESDVLVEVRAASVNQLDLKLAAGDFKAFLPSPMPLVLGHDVAGVVAEVGRAVTRFSVGDSVFARPADGRIGTFAERIAIAERDVAALPRTVSMVEAAALPLVALTAWQALVEVAAVQPGQRVLVHGGAGGFGSTAVQIAKHLGAHVATTGSESNLQWLRELGADEVIDYRTQDFEAVLSGYDLVIDGIGGDNLRKSLRVLRPGGRAIGIAGPPDPSFAMQIDANPAVALAMRGLSAGIRRRAKKLGVEYSFLWMRADGDQLTRIAQLVDAGALRPVVSRVLPFDQIPAALEGLTRRGNRGKIVVSRAD